jgi:hypothetical protein
MIFLLDLAQTESTHIKKLVIACKSKEPVAAYIHKVYGITSDEVMGIWGAGRGALERRKLLHVR